MNCCELEGKLTPLAQNTVKSTTTEVVTAQQEGNVSSAKHLHQSEQDSNCEVEQWLVKMLKRVQPEAELSAGSSKLHVVVLDRLIHGYS